MTRVTGSDASTPRRLDATTIKAPFIEAETIAAKTIVSKLRCVACSAWHSGVHVVDGVDVHSAYCARCSMSVFRCLWAQETQEHDPRAPQMRFKPATLPSAW